MPKIHPQMHALGPREYKHNHTHTYAVAHAQEHISCYGGMLLEN